MVKSALILAFGVIMFIFFYKEFGYTESILWTLFKVLISLVGAIFVAAMAARQFRA